MKTNAPILWTNVLFFSLTALITLIAVPWYAFAHGFDGVQITMMVLMLGYAGMSITMGYHRMWSHRAFDAHPLIRILLALGGALAIQHSALHWCSDHRVHHHHVDDNEKDPYSAKMGFWYSHMGWMLREYQMDRYDDYDNVKDLQKDPIVAWQHKHYWTLVWVMNLGVTGLLAVLHGDVIGTLLLVGVARLTLSQHFTFFINSLAHIFGRRPYSVENTARDNGWIALITYGEGYHNFHHRFASDYRNGIRWWQFDPTKWMIKGLSFVGLTENLRQYSDERIERAKALVQLTRAQDKVADGFAPEEWLEQIKSEYEELGQKMNAFFEAKKSMVEAKKNAMAHHDLNELKERCRELKERWIEQRRQWNMLLAMNV